MKFEWNDKKNKANIKKHRIDFVDVPAMFDHPMIVNVDTRKDYGEDRCIGIGLLKSVTAVIVFTEPTEETIRIISARKATEYERKKYENEITHSMETAQVNERPGY